MIEVMTHQFPLALTCRLLSSHVAQQWLPEEASLMVRTNPHTGSASMSRDSEALRLAAAACVPGPQHICATSLQIRAGHARHC